MNIQQILNEYKRQTNVTNDYIAQKIGVTKSTVSRWCNGQIKKISPDTLQKLSSLIGIDFDQMTRITQFSFEKPILGTVKAGYGLFAQENIEGYLSVSEKEYAQGDYSNGRDAGWEKENYGAWLRANPPEQTTLW